MFIKPFSEIVGNLDDVNFEDNQVVCKISFQKVIELPLEAIDRNKIESLKGVRIGIFNDNGNYKIRKIKSRR